MTEEYQKYVDMRNECYRKRKDNNETISYFTGFDDGYLAGAKENGVVWHDLRKDPDDLPNDNGTVLVRLEKPITQFSYFCHPEKKFSCWNTEYECNIHLHNVIAWCEIPQFKE